MERLLRPLRNKKGFTLTEAMVVIGIAALMVGFTYTGFSSFHKREQVRSAAHQFSSVVKRARFRAMEKHMSHTIDISADKTKIYLFSDPPCDESDDNPSCDKTKTGYPFYFDNIHSTLLGENDSKGNTKVQEIDLLKQFNGIKIVKFFQDEDGNQTPIRFDVQGFPRDKNGKLISLDDTDMEDLERVRFEREEDSGKPEAQRFSCEVVIQPLGGIKVTCNDKLIGQ